MEKTVVSDGSIMARSFLEHPAGWIWIGLFSIKIFYAPGAAYDQPQQAEQQNQQADDELGKQYTDEQIHGTYPEGSDLKLIVAFEPVRGIIPVDVSHYQTRDSGDSN